MRIGDFKIVRDGETVAVLKLGENKKTGEETARPVAYVRDLHAALLSVKRKMSVEAFDKQSDVKKLIKVLEDQYNDIKSIVKRGCRECLND
jgi:hypothetical protein